MANSYTVDQARSVNYSDVFRFRFLSEFSPAEGLHSETLLQGALESYTWSRQYLSPAETQLSLHRKDWSFLPASSISHFCPELSLPFCLCARKCQRYCLLFCALYSCFTHFCLWASLFPEVSDLESQQDKINSNDLGLGISVWPWLCHLLTVRLLPSIIKWE